MAKHGRKSPTETPKSGSRAKAQRPVTDTSLDEAQADDAYRNTEVHNGVLKEQNLEWQFKSKNFFDTMEASTYKSLPYVSNEGQISVTLATYFSGKQKHVTMNFWLSSGIFTLTGQKKFRDPHHAFFHKLVTGGPHALSEPHTSPQMSDTEPEENKEQGAAGEGKKPTQSANIIEAEEETTNKDKIVTNEETQAIIVQGTNPPLTLPPLADYLAEQMIETVIKRTPSGTHDQQIFKIKHTKILIPLIMKTLMVTKIMPLPGQTANLAKPYLDVVKETASVKLHKCLTK